MFAGERADPLFSNKVGVIGTRERLSFNISIRHQEQGTECLFNLILTFMKYMQVYLAMYVDKSRYYLLLMLI